ncbi:mpv17-like protein 2 [Bemisia tabaci]|uniref:mpv17-like protein 2 n=1 Tax=Bemisia tabaci TaxID=7038 RepID=UPI003B289273
MMFKKLTRLKSLLFSKYLIVTNVGLSGTLSGVGDIIEQRQEAHFEGSKWNPRRTLNLTISGVTVGVICHTWYKYLESILPGTTMRTVVKKVLLDQLVYSPVGIFVLLVTLGTLEHADFPTILEDFKKKGTNLYIAEWFVWPPAQVVNFYFVPVQYRVFYDNLVSLGYDIYTSHVTYHKQFVKNSPESR